MISYLHSNLIIFQDGDKFYQYVYYVMFLCCMDCKNHILLIHTNIVHVHKALLTNIKSTTVIVVYRYRLLVRDNEMPIII